MRETLLLLFLLETMVAKAQFFSSAEAITKALLFISQLLSVYMQAAWQPAVMVQVAVGTMQLFS